MNKYQIALDEIKKQLVVVDYLNGKAVSQEPIFEEQTETLQELIDIYPEYLELKERATPKKPIGERLDRLCPNCEKRLYWDDETCDYIYEDYCIHCGQHLDWSENG